MMNLDSGGLYWRQETLSDLLNAAESGDFGRQGVGFDNASGSAERPDYSCYRSHRNPLKGHPVGRLGAHNIEV